MPELNELLVELAAWALLAVVAGGVLFGLTLVLPRDQPRFLPPARGRAIPWEGGLVVLAFLFLFLLVPGVVMSFLSGSGFFHRLYGPGFAGNPALPAETGSPVDKVRFIVWVSLLAFPIAVGVVGLTFQGVARTRGYHFGFVPGRIIPDAALGYLVWLPIAPAVLALNSVVNVWSQSRFGIEPQSHPLLDLLQTRPGLVDWSIVIATAVLAAPFQEEFFFRGILQPWLGKKWWGGTLAVWLALLVAAKPLLERDFLAARGKPAGVSFGLALAPVLFVLVLAPGVWLCDHRLLRRWRPGVTLPRWLPRWVRRPGTLPAVYGTSLLFATVHASVWPSPVALFPLGLALGLLAVRTQGVTGPVVLHALFNAVSCLMLVLVYGFGLADVKGSDTTVPRTGPPSVMTSTGVPGVWWPRRM